jgi:hypothetical protein
LSEYLYLIIAFFAAAMVLGIVLTLLQYIELRALMR